MRLAAMLAVSALVHGAAVLWLAAPRERREALVIEAEPVALLWGEAAEPGAGAWPSPAGADAALEELPTEAALGPTAPQAVPVARAEPAEVEAPSAPPAEGAAGPAA
ncbi:MAG: hypothetical protein N2Z67_13480, partial [Acetobacteraceae bacterium]|nr:hypothetical protein [Acetobacteraceae bacterium]